MFQFVGSPVRRAMTQGHLAEDTRMGVWGPGNFENDRASDHLMKVCNPLLEQIVEAMEDPSCLDLDNQNADIIVMANLEMINCLSEHLGRYERGETQDFLYPCVLPPPEIVVEWKQRYLKVWDACMESREVHPDHKTRRREVIVETFDRTERLARGRHEGKA